LYDLNAEFYATDSSALFLHAAHGIGTDFSQSGEMGPSIFSITGLALRLHHDVDSALSVRAAVIDGVPGNPKHPERMAATLRGEDGLLAAGELDFHPGAYRVGIGAWRYSRRQPTLDTSGEAISRGTYGFVELPLSGAVLEDASARFFLRGGIAEDNVNRFSDFIGTGVVVDGAVWGRAGDSAGFAIARAHNGKPYRELTDPVGSAETAFELTYRINVNDHFALQPDLQYVIDPDTNPALDDALVVGVRAELTLY
jgi:porin